MAILIRGAVVVVLWLASNRMKDAAMSPLARKAIDGLAWPDRLRLVLALVRDQRVPWLSRAILMAPAAYLVSPIDLVPDFIPFLGQLDDALVFSVAMDLAALLIPDRILEQHLVKVTGEPSKG